MNLLSLILIAMAIIVGGCVFYVAWELSSGRYESGDAPGSSMKSGPDGSKESEDPSSP
ncbi:MAG: hypothetical protein QGF87_08985 [Woeseiaceae bacterium]|nr:hypothetical protein [Woeseiaceae bacterium]